MLSVYDTHTKHALSLQLMQMHIHMLALAVVGKLNEKSSLRVTARLSCINLTINVRVLLSSHCELRSHIDRGNH